MARLSIAFAIVLVSACALRAQDWQTFRYPGDGFSAAFPSTPQQDVRAIDAPGGAVQLHSYTLEVDQVALFIGVCDYGTRAQSTDVDSMLEGAKAGALQNSKAQLTRESKITLGAYRGIEFESDSEVTHYITRIYIVGTRMFQTLVVSPVASPYTDTARFLDSFQLIAREQN